MRRLCKQCIVRQYQRKYIFRSVSPSKQNGENRTLENLHLNSATMGSTRHYLASLLIISTHKVYVLSTSIWYTTRLNYASCWFLNLGYIRRFTPASGTMQKVCHKTYVRNMLCECTEWLELIMFYFSPSESILKALTDHNCTKQNRWCCKENIYLSTARALYLQHG